MYTGPFAILLAICLAVSLLAGVAFTLAAKACESIGCVIGAALIDTAFHIVLVCLLFEPIRRFVIRLNQDAERRNLIRVFTPLLEAMMSGTEGRANLVMWLASFNPTIMRLSAEEVVNWSMLTEVVRGESLGAATSRLETFLHSVRRNLPQQGWRGLFPN